MKRAVARLSLAPALLLCVAACTAEAPTGAEGDGLTNRLWTRVDGGQPPGSMVAFLDNGVMLMDSCWETYRVNIWRREGDDRLVWSEDAAEISAEIALLSENALTLRLDLPGGGEEQAFTALDAPFLCPDRPR